MTERIESRKNPAVAHAVKLLTQAKHRRESGEFAAEGDKLFCDALRAGVEITLLLVSEDIMLSVPDAVRVCVLPKRLFEQISTQKSPQGVIFTAKRPETQKSGSNEQLIILDGVQDPGNVGTVIRTAAAMGMDAVLLVNGCADPFSYKTVRASMGGVFRIPVIECEVTEIPRNVGGRAIAYASPDATRSISEIDWKGCVPVIGSEGQGISERVRELCGAEFTIPMSKKTESLNASVAAAIVMWEMRKGIL